MITSGAATPIGILLVLVSLFVTLYFLRKGRWDTDATLVFGLHIVLSLLQFYVTIVAGCWRMLKGKSEFLFEGGGGILQVAQLEIFAINDFLWGTVMAAVIAGIGGFIAIFKIGFRKDLRS